MTSPRILIVENDAASAQDLRQRLERLGCLVTGLARSGDEAAAQAEGFPPDLALVNIALDGAINGPEIAARLKQARRMAVVYLLAYTDDGILRRAGISHSFEYLARPFDDEALRAAIDVNLHLAGLEEQAASAAARLEAAGDLAAEGIASLDAAGRCLWASSRLGELLGQPAGALIGSNVSDWLDPEDLAAAPLDLDALARKPAMRWAGRLDGNGRPVELTCRRLEGGGYQCLVHDLSERFAAEEALHYSEARFHNLLEILPAGAALLNARQRPVEVNSAMTRLVEVAEADFQQGRPADWRFIRADGSPLPAEEFPSVAAARQGQPVHDQVVGLVRPGQDTLWLKLSAAPLPGGDDVAVAALDISERMLAEQTLQALIDDPNQGLALAQAGRLILVNAALAALTGYSPEELQAMPAEMAAGLLHLPEPAQAAGRRQEFRLTAKNGLTRWVETRASLVHYGGRQAVQLLVADINERRQAEMALAASRDALERLIQQSPVGIQVFNLNGLCLDVNQAYLDIFGVQRGMLVGRFNLFKDGRAHASGLAEAALRALRGETVSLGDVGFSVPLTGRGDGRAILNVTVYPVMAESGQASACVALYTDVTQLRQTESAYRLVSTLTSDYAFSFRVDRDGQLVREWTTDAFERITGYTPDNPLVARGLDAIVHPDDRAQAADWTVRTMAGERFQADIRIIRKDGQVRWLRRVTQPIWDKQLGRVTRMVGAASDVTPEKTAEHEREALLAAERAQRLKAETLAQATLALARPMTLKDALDGILAEAKRLVPFDTANIMLVENDRLRVVAWQGYSGSDAEHFLAAFDQPVQIFATAVEVIAERKPVTITDTQSDPRWVSTGAMDWIRSSLNLPLIAGDKVLGILNVDSNQPGLLGPDEADSLMPLAGAAALALQRAQLTDSLRSELAERRRADTQNLRLVVELNGRIRGLTLLHTTARRLQGRATSTQELLTALAADLPAAWQYPEIASARVVFEDVEARTPKFARSPWMQETSFVTAGRQRGEIQVAYSEDRPRAAEGPFLAEERALLNSLAELLSLHFERSSAEEAAGRYVNRMELLHAIDRAILEAQSPEGTAAAGLAHVQRIVPSRRSSLALFDFEADEARLLAYAGSAESPFQPGDRASLDDYGRQAIEALRRGPIWFRLGSKPLLTLLDPAERDDPAGGPAWLAVPLNYRGGLIGALNLCPETPGAIGEAHLDIAREIADHLSIAVQNARLFEAEHAARLQANTLLEAAQTVSSTLSLNEVLERLLHEAGRILSFTSGSIMVFEDGQPVLVALTGHSGREQVVSKAIQADLRGGAIINRAIQSGQPRYIADVRDDPDWAVYDERTSYIRSWIGAPLKARDRTVGLLTLDSDRPGAFSPEDLSQAQALAAQAAVAVENARLFDAERRARQQAEALQAAAAAMTQSLDLREVLEAMLEYVERLAPYDTACVLLLTPDGRTLTVAGARGYDRWGDTSFRTGKTFPVSALSGVQRALQTRTSVLVADTQAEPEWQAASRENYVRSWIGVPLLAEGRAIGVYSLQKVQPDYFTPTHVRLTEALAAQGVIAIQNAQLYQQVRAGQEQLHALSQRLVTVQEDERRHLARELHDEIGQMLTGLKLLLGAIPRVPPGRLNEKVAEAGEVLNQLVEQVHTLSLNLRPVILDDLGLTSALIWLFDRYTRQTGVQVHFESVGLEQRLPVDLETTTYRIVQEALTNVARYAGVQEAWVRLRLEAGQVRLQIQDRGQGFDAADGLASRQRAGLAGMQERAALLGGHLEVESAPGAGTNISAVLPVDSLNTEVE